ncbi:MAG: serine/threonine protein kinase [Planctomycetia bacterium]|nr:serine/threonine protein kinase [Planctomycetia bacterium]
MAGPAIRNLLFGKLAVSTRFITEEQLQECLSEQKELESQGEPIPKLGEMLERKGYLTRSQIQIVLESMARTQKRRFGEIAQAFQFVTEAQVNAALEVQGLLEKAPEPETVTLKDDALVVYRRFFSQKRLHGERPRIGEILEATGALKPHQVSAIAEEQSKVIVTCGGCDASLNITGFAPGQKLRCAQCGSVLTVSKTSDGVMELQLPPMTGVFRSPVPGGAAPPEAPATPAPAAPPAPTLPTPSDKISMVQAPLPGLDTGGPLPVQFGDYRLVQLLGEDTTSRTFKAEQRSRQRTVTLKVMRRSAMLDDEFREHFLENARLAATLEHPHLRKIYSVSKVDDRFCVAMEYLEGDSVYGLLQKNGKFGPVEAVRMIRPVLDALAAAHRKGLVHGDFRPSVLLVAKDGRIRLTDLGLSAKPTEGVLKVSESGRVAPFYIAPECVTGDRKVDRRIDIYSAGATLFHMITGKPPFVGKNPFEVLMKLSTEPLPHLRTLDPAIPDALNSVVHRMLDPEPDARYATCEQVLADLENAASAPAGGAAAEQKQEAAPRGLVPVLVAAAVLVAAFIGWRAWQSSERGAAFEAVRSRAAGARVSRAEFNAARAELRRFSDAWPGSTEASQAEAELRALDAREKEVAERELADASRDIDGLLAAGKPGTALTRANTLTFWSDPDSRLDALRQKVETGAAKSWETVATDVLKLADDGKLGDAESKLNAAVRERGIASDAARAADVLGKIEAIRQKREAAARAEAAEREKREAEERRLREAAEAKRRWESLSAAFDKVLAQWDAKAAQAVLSQPEAALAGTAEDRERLAKIALWFSEVRAAAVTAVIGAQSTWDGKAENDRRLKATLKGADCRAADADAAGVIFATPSGTREKVAWEDLDPRVGADALARGAEFSKRQEHRLAIAAWCAARAVGADPALDRWLLEAAERRGAEAPDFKEAAATIEKRLAAWAERAQQEALERLQSLAGSGKFAEAALQNRNFRNAFGRRAWAQARAAELDALAKSAFAAGAPAEKLAWEDFSQGTGALEAGEGWKAAGGILAGSGKDEKLRLAVAGIEEISVLVRFQKPEFRLALTAGNAEIRLEPSRPRFDALVRPEDGSPVQKSFLEKDDELRAGTWHLLQVRFTGSAVVVMWNGEERGSVPMAGNPGELAGLLTGVSQTQPGSVEMDCLMVKRK